MFALIYLLKASLILALFWLVYKVFLEKETYHHLKRMYLWLGYVTSLLLPSLYFTKTVIIASSSFSSFTNSTLKNTSIQVEELTLAEYMIEAIKSYYIIEVIVFGVSFWFLLKFFKQLYKLLVEFNAAQKILIKGIYYIETTSPDVAFSFFNYVAYNPKLVSSDQLSLILSHEEAHVKLKHSVDKLFAQLFTALFWFNPVAWWYKKSIDENLEYQADAFATQNTNVKHYQTTLYKVVKQHYNPHDLKHAFSQSSIKKRIIMLQKTNTSSFKNYVKLSLITPLLIAFVFLFQIETLAQIKNETTETKTSIQIDKVEVTYGAETKLETIQEDITFLKKEFNVDMSFRNHSTTAEGYVKGITLDVDTNKGFSGSVTSPNLSKTPVYMFYYPKEDVSNPFGMGINPDQNKDEIGYDKIKEAQSIKIENKIYTIRELKDKYIPYTSLDYDSKQKLLQVETTNLFEENILSSFKTLLNQVELSALKDVEFKFLNITKEAKITTGSYKGRITSKAIAPPNQDTANQKTKKVTMALETTTNDDVHSSDLNEAEVFIVNGERFPKRKLIKKGIFVDQLNYNKTSKTLSISTPKEFDKPIVKDISEALEKAEATYGTQLMLPVKFIHVLSTNSTLLITINDLKINSNPENAIQNTSDKNSLIKNQNILFIVDGKKISQDEFRKIDPEKIVSLNVIKNPIEIKKYTSNEEEYEGVILITTSNKK